MKEEWHRLNVEVNTPLRNAVDDVSNAIGATRSELILEALQVYFQIIRLGLFNSQVPTVNSGNNNLPLSDFAPKLARAVLSDILHETLDDLSTEN